MFYVTFGFGSQKANCYSEVPAGNTQEARDVVEDAVGKNYAFIYSEDEFAGQPEKYNLKKIPL